jgi:hypothetical protein
MDTTTGTTRDVFSGPSGSSGPGSSAAPPAWAVTCLNCSAALDGPYCAQCGQRAAPPHATLKELGGEAFSEFAGWDGKFITTLKLLFFKPGELTRQFLDGRRVYFISPLRLYLSASVLFFLMMSMSHPPRHASAKPAAVSQQDQLLLDNIDASPAVMRPLVRRIATDKQGFTDDVVAALPKAFFAMLPVFAAIMALFYRRRHFAEHLYFSIHVHAFVFSAFGLCLVLQLLHVPRIPYAIAFAIVSLWVPLYTHLAIVRVYGGSQGLTLAKELGISALYAACSVPVITGLAMWVAWSTS